MPSTFSQDEARKSVQALQAGIAAAEKLPTCVGRNHAVDLAIECFRGTEYGKAALDSLRSKGYVMVPLPMAEKASSMLSAVEDELLVRDGEGRLVVSQAVFYNEPKIKSEPRFMIEPRKLGKAFVGNAQDMAETLSCVVLALAYGPYERVETERLSVLLNNEAVKKQVLHRDQKAEDIEARLLGNGSGTRSRPQPPPFSAIFALQEQTVLHAIDGSHLQPLETTFSSEQTRKCAIPVGSACLFHATLVHAGMASVGMYHARMHCYFKARGCTSAYNGDVQLVTDEAM